MNYRKAVGWIMILLGFISLILLWTSVAHLMHTAFTAGSSSSETHSLYRLEDRTMLWNVGEICCTVALWIGGAFLLAPRRNHKAAPPL